MTTSKRRSKTKPSARPRTGAAGSISPPQLEPVYPEDIASVLVYGEGWFEVQPESLTIRVGRVKSESAKPTKLEWIAYFTTPEGKRVEIPLRRISLARLR